MRLGSLFSGYGGLEQGVQAVLGGTVAWHSEVDKGACKVLAHRYPDVPNLGDITAVDWAQVEPVDVLTGGFPCQPVSEAGKRLGDQDERWLWDDVIQAVRVLRPRLVVLENVRGLLTAGGGRLFGRVVGSLADVGYDTAWYGLRAADVGAPHGRSRVFIAAYPVGAGLEGADVARDAHSPAGQPAAPNGGGRIPAGQCAAIASDADGQVGGWEQSGSLASGPPQGVVQQERWGVRRGGCLPAPDADCNGQQSVGRVDPKRRDPDRRDRQNVAWGKYEPPIRRWEHTLGRPAPAPTEPGRKGQPRLSPVFVEWKMGLPAGWVTDVPGVTRNEALKVLGNGVVPAQAAAALGYLLDVEAGAA